MRSAENRRLKLRCVEGPRGRSPFSAIQAIDETASGAGFEIQAMEIGQGPTFT